MKEARIVVRAFFICMVVSLIVAVARDWAIGKDNDLLWKIKDDLRLFMRTTSQHVVIHGRRSYESIGKPLPNRTNIIVTRSQDYNAPGCFVVNSLEEGIELAGKLEQRGEVFILGGAQIYKQSLEYVDRMYISHVEADFPEADAHFPPIDLSQWKKVRSESFPQNERNEFGFTFCLYDRA